MTPLLPVEKIMRRCNLGRRSVFLYLKRLEAKGFVKRQRQWSVDRSMDSNVYRLDLKRYFPKGEYLDSVKLWGQITKQLEEWATIPPEENPRYATRINLDDVHVLQRIVEAFLQKNSRTLHLVTETDLYEETLFKNLSVIKQAAVSLKIPVRRFEAFRKPHFP
jgi:hypothetical protein